MHEYVIYDIWTALGKAFSHFFSWFFVVWGLLFSPYLYDDTGEYVIPHWGLILGLSITIITFVISIFIYLANRGYVINMETGLITFPRSDVENSILAIILMYPYWNLMRTQTIHASEIDNVYLDTHRWTTTSRVSNGQTTKGKTKYRTVTTRHVSYNINVVGTFGSANLDFGTRQKRDEVRNAIEQCVKQYRHIKVDKKVAEFD